MEAPQSSQENISESGVEDFKSIWQNLIHFFKELLDLNKDLDKKGTIQDVKDNISMKGHTAWILIFSILIASIGLNVSSTAVVIGAMLLSPLMGPILGIGMSIGINDIDTLKRSLINVGVTVGLSVITSFLFFSIPIFKESTPELLARTKPDVRDVLIALAGGLALIVALSRRKEMTNTIAGIAIATALMPPLCTAGFGLATGNINYFLGAMFLFLINSIFIALATFFMVRFLGFPMVKYINSAKRKRISQMASFVAFVIFSLSIYLFYGLFLENNFKQNAQEFIQELKDSGVSIIDDSQSIDYKNRTINLFVFGKTVSKTDEEKWQSNLEKRGLKNTFLNVQQGKDDADLRNDINNLKDLYIQNQKIIGSRDESIQQKEFKINDLESKLNVIKNNQIPFDQISDEAEINYENLIELSYYKRIKTNFSITDTLVVFEAKWKDSLSNEVVENDMSKLKLWLKKRLKIDSIQVLAIPK
ncbi:MAG: DUF389 domain-containing protein [Flavobacteriaceae bacterium]|nr:DUF389 domain-containing protein [Flavobacteriaceae bacterium]